MNANGEQMGGVVGFLKTLRRLVSEAQPRAVYVVWEGGGSARRRAIYPAYKANRKPEKLNRFYEDDIPESEENRKHQLVTLLACLKKSPTCQLYVANVEADDVIAHLCCSTFRNDEKIIVSSDRDFLQLLDERTRVYSLHKKTYVTHEQVVTDFGVLAQNFAVAKALCGDMGDNVPGVKGMGWKTLNKLYPLLAAQPNVLLQEVIDFSASHIDEGKMYRKVYEQADDVRRNYRLVFLDGSMLSPDQMHVIDNAVSTYCPHVDKMALIRIIAKEGLGDFDVHDFLHSFHSVENIKYV
jgi:5'-3' exonuclease